MTLLRYALAALVACALTAGAYAASPPKPNPGPHSSAAAASTAVAVSGAAAGAIAGGGAAGASITHQHERQSPAVSAPSLATSGETCMGSTSVGGSAAGIGLAIGTTWDSAECQRRMNSQQLRLLGQNDAALALLCQNPGVADALAAVGKRCPGAAAAPVSLAPSAPASDYCARNPADYYCRAK